MALDIVILAESGEPEITLPVRVNEHARLPGIVDDVTLLLDQFLAEERSPYVRELLNSALEAVKVGTAPSKRRFEFNRFDGAIDAEKKEVVLEDVLDATDAGTQTVALQELEKGLRRLAEAQSN